VPVVFLRMNTLEMILRALWICVVAATSMVCFSVV
jgi:hypothetical protein